MSDFVRLADFRHAGEALAILRRGLDSGRPPHALLISGPPGVGKRTLSRAYAAAIFCERGADCEGCDVCRRLAERRHPDFLVVRRVDRSLKEQAPLDDVEEDALDATARKTLSTLIRVFQVRELTHHASFASKEAPARLFVVDPADRMNLEAQNALLKTLEEPPPTTRILLLTTRPHRLLPTVRSRCLQVRLPALPPAVLARSLQDEGMDPNEARERAGLSGGRPGFARSLDPESRRAAREARLELLEACAGGGVRALAELSDWVGVVGVGSEPELQEGLDGLAELLREGLRLAVGAPAETLLDPALEARIGAVAERLGLDRAAAALEDLDRTRDALRFNLNRTLAVEAWLATLAGAGSPHPRG